MKSTEKKTRVRSGPETRRKMHWLKTDKPACGRKITSWSINAVDWVTCKNCQAVIREQEAETRRR